MTLNIAHRGARSLAPENTLAAARKALEAGADMWEFDVSVTADGELFVTHDLSLTGTTNAETVFPDRAPWHFTDFTLAEIRQLETGAAFARTDPFEQIAAGAVSEEELAGYQGEPMPTVREALQFTRDHSWRVNVELKFIPPPLDTFPVIEQTVALIEELDMVDQVTVSSFVPLFLQQAKRLCPALTLAVLTSGTLPPSTWAHYRPAGAPVDLANNPMLYFNGSNPADFLAQLGATIYNPRYRITRPADIAAWQAAGLQVNVWTVNDPAHMRRLVRVGANGLITDFPQLLTQILAEEATPQ